MAPSSCRSLYPEARRMALRSHCRPKTASRAPTTRRSPVSGTRVRAGPTAATMAARTTSAAAIPWNVDRHSRVRPAARTIVSASTASTAQATKTVRTRASEFTRSPRGVCLVRALGCHPAAGRCGRGCGSMGLRFLGVDTRGVLLQRLPTHSQGLLRGLPAIGAEHVPLLHPGEPLLQLVQVDFVLFQFRVGVVVRHVLLLHLGQEVLAAVH